MANVTLTHVSKNYDKVQAVKDLSLEIQDKEFLVILGPPGAGKTSTLKMIAGVEDASQGEILFDGQPVNRLLPNQRDVAMVFESYALYPHMTAFDNIAYPLRESKRRLGLSERDISKRVEQIAELLQISEHLQRRPAHLSGGQRQRVALGRTLVRHPHAFLLDEPIAHLDARLRHQLRGELKRIQRERKVTTIYSTPDYLEAIAMADRVVVLFGGEVKQIGTPDQIMGAPASVNVAEFVGDPPMNIMPAQIVTHDGQLWFDLGGFEIPMPEKLQRAVKTGNFTEGITLGMRPGDVVIHRTQVPPPAFATELYVAERLHRKTVLSLSRGTTLLKVNAPADFEGKIGDRIWVELPGERLFGFDPKTGLLLVNQV